MRKCVVFHTLRAVGNGVGKTLVRICRNQSITCSGIVNEGQVLARVRYSGVCMGDRTDRGQKIYVSAYIF